MTPLRVECPASYPPGAKLVLVGEAPGREEVEKGEGFVGQAGRVLQKACSAAGLDWSTLGKSNVVKRRPFPDSNDFRRAFYEQVEEAIYTPKGNLSKRTKKVTRRTGELTHWQGVLAAELQQYRPNLVVACGGEALEATTGLTGITNYRGSVLGGERIGGIKVLATEHPSFVMRGNFERFWVLAGDLRKAKREMEFPEVRREEWTELVNPSLGEVLGFVRDVGNLGLPWTLDVETRAGTLACFAIAMRYPEGVHATCIPVQSPQGPHWSPEEEMEIWQAMREAANANPYLCNQNIEYDIYYLLRYGVEPSGVWMDTMLAHSLLYPEFPKGLDFLCSWYLDDVVYYKGEGRSWKDGDRDEELWRYNVKDAVYTLRIVEEIDRRLRERGLWEMYHGKTISY